MATIFDLNISISQLSPDEAFELVKKRRLSRRTPKANNKKAVKKAAKTRAAKKKVSTKSLLKQMTPAQKAALLKELTG